MIPRRVFSPSLKLLTSENRLKGNSQLDCESQALPSNTGTIKKQTLPSTDLININIVSSINVENNKNTSCTNVDKNDSNNKINNDVSHKKVIDVDIVEENGSKSNKLEHNLIGTQEIVAQHQENNQSNSSSSSSSNSMNNDDDANELSKKIELSGKRRDVETKINNVPLRDVIQRKVSKLPHQLLHGSKELSTKLATAATTTTKNVSKTKRLLFRRKTTAITKDQIEAAKLLQNINNSSSILLTLNNEPITVSLAQQQPKTKQKHQQQQPEKSQVNQSHGGEYDNNNRQSNLNAHQTENELQQYYRQSSTPTKQKQPTNNVTIVTASQNSSFHKRTNAKTDNKYKLNEANRNKNNSFALKSNGVTIGNAEANSNENCDIVDGETVSISKRFYSKQSLAANNNFKSNNFALQIRASVPVPEPSEPLNGKALKIVQGKKPARPPSYVNPPSPTASNTNVKSNTFLACKQTLNNFPNDCTTKNNRITDEYENYAVPYVETPTTPLDELNTDSSIHIRIANQFQSQSKVNPTQKSHSKNQNNLPFLSRSQNRNNKESTNEILLIANDCMLFDAFGQSTSSDSSDSNDALKLNQTNDKITNENKMDPHTISNLTSPCDMLTKPEFSSSHLQNIPVRPRKGVPHLENYCLFDPSKDFVNEKELKKKYGLVSGDCMPYPIKILDKRTNEDELIKETIYEDHDYVYDTLEDVKEEDEDENDEMVESFPNYFTIDPDYIEQNKMETLFCNANHLQPIVESETEDIYSDTNANLNKTFHVYENQQPAPLKKSPQIEKIVRQSSQPIITTNAAKKLMSSSLNSKCSYTSKNEPITIAKGQNGKATLKNRTKLSPPTDLPLRNTNQSAVKVAISKKRNSFTLKHSISTPQLSLKDLLADNAALPMVEIEAKNNVSSVGAANRLSQCKMRRPASQHSDADSGFLSPVTPPSNDAFNQSNSTYPQCDTIQGYIEVSYKL